MKHTYKIATLVLLFAILPSCRMRSVSLSVMQPAQITFPADIKTLVMVDRSKFANQATNIIEGLLTGELPGEDKAGVQEVMNGFQERIMQSPRFTIKRAAEVLEGNSITAAFPNALDWSQVEQLCQRYGADALVAIELFDSDFIITNGKRITEKEVTENGVKVKKQVNEYYANGVANLKIGFRVYDPKSRTIADQQTFTKTNTWEATGTNLQQALAALIGKSQATQYLGRQAGSDYAYKIAPLPVWVGRSYYIRPKSQAMTTGRRQVEVKTWELALNTWQNGLKYAGSDKEKGRLAYNIALAYEVLGNLDEAKKWAASAYVDYGNKNARNYSATLDNRIYSEQRLKDQMGQ